MEHGRWKVMDYYSIDLDHKDQGLLMRQVQHEGKENVSTTNSSPLSPRETSLWSEYSCWHLVRTPALSRAPPPHASIALLHCVTLHVLLVSVRMVHDETELSFLVLGGSGGDVAGL